MAGLGLSNAVDSYMQGRDWKEQQAYRDDLKAANDAFSTTIQADAAKWAMTGAEGQFAPGPETYLKAAQARMTELAKRGRYDDYMKGSAALIQPINHARQQALDSSGGDELALASKVYPTFMDNRELQSADWVDGSGPNGEKGTKQLRLVLSDGSVKFMPAGKLTQMVQQSIATPQMRLAEASYLYGVKRDAARAEETRTTNEQEAELASDLEDKKQGNRISLADFQSERRLGEIAARGGEARETKQTIPGKAASSGSSSGANSDASLSLRQVQQQRVRLDARRKEAQTLLRERNNAAKQLVGDAKRKALADAQSAYDAAMVGLDREDKVLQRRLEGGGTPGLGLDQFDSPSKSPASTGARPDLKSFYKN